MAQWLRALAALTENLGLIPRTHLVPTDYLQFQIQPPLLASVGTRHTSGA